MNFQAVGYYIIQPFFWVVSLLPFWLLHRLSDAMYLLVRLAGYRKTIIEKNLTHSFPNLNTKEIVSIRNRYYHHFCDLFVETLKLQSISENEIKRRMVFENTELVESYAKQNKDVIAVLAHYGNWEWIPAINLHVTPLGVEVYHPLKNKYMDRFMLKLRSKFGTSNFTMKSTMREILMLKRKNQRFIIGLISDQSPARVKIQYRTVFLNQNTPIHLGAEKIAKATGDPVVFLRVEKTGRSRYKATIIPVTDTPKATADYEITEQHVRMLEKQIVEKPEYWLWSHKRWKYSPNRLAIDAASLQVAHE
ncbi:MAG: lysophospholipid acyltransferase family protein [Breznakibacter sp.]